MTNFFRPRNSFLQNTAWQNQALNALHYNTSQQGSVLPLIYGTTRQQINLINLDGYRGPQGKKGKSGSLPISGTHQTGKGSAGGKGKGGKKNAHYSVNVDFAICQGPIPGGTANSAVYSSSGVEGFSSTGLHFYNGSDGQAPDPHFSQVGYSGTAHVTGTPMDLGQSPVLPNLAFEVTGLLAGRHTGGYPQDANPADIVMDFLSNVRYGAGFPAECVAFLAHDDDGVVVNTYGDYCQAAALMVSTSLDGHQKAIEWLAGLITLTNAALVWSGKLLKVIPYGDLTLDNNGAHWEPNFTAQYDLTDHDFLPWQPHQDGAVPNPGDDDPIIMTRTNPSDADNWLSMEYTDRNNFYNSTTLTSFDQGAIDTYGLRIGDSLPGRAFTGQNQAQISIQLILQRRLYIRNSNIKFQLGWQFALLEPMDMVSLTGRVGDNYLNQYPVRITSIEENDNGDLTITAEDPQSGIASPPQFLTIPAILHGDPSWNVRGAFYYQWITNASVSVGDPAYDPIYDFRSNQPPDSPQGTFSTWISIDPPHAPLPPGTVGFPVDTGTTDGESFGFFQTQTLGFGGAFGEHFEIAAGLDWEGRVFVIVHGVRLYQSDINVIGFLGLWQHVLITWNLPFTIRVWVNGTEIPSTLGISSLPSTVTYSTEGSVVFWGISGSLGLVGDVFLGCSNDLWWDSQQRVEDPSRFRNLNGTPKNLGVRGEGPLGRPPNVFFHYPETGAGYPAWPGDHITTGSGYYGINRAGYRCDDGVYWASVNNPSGATSGPGSFASLGCDPEHPNFGTSGPQPAICSYPFLPYT